MNAPNAQLIQCVRERFSDGSLLHAYSFARGATLCRQSVEGPRWGATDLSWSDAEDADLARCLQCMKAIYGAVAKSGAS